MKIRCRIGYHKLGPAEHLQDSINSRTCEDCGKPFLYDGEVLIGDFVLPPIANQHSLTIQDWLDQVNESAPTKLELIEWKPIDQAKKDGTEYLLWLTDGTGMEVGFWGYDSAKDETGWRTWFGASVPVSHYAEVKGPAQPKQ